MRLIKSLYKKRYWLALLLPTSCVAGIVPIGSPYLFGAEAYGDFMLGNMYSQTVSPDEVPDLNTTDFQSVWCVKWSHGGLDGGTLGYTCGGYINDDSSKYKGQRAIFVNEEIGVLGTKEGRPIIGISLLDEAVSANAVKLETQKNKQKGNMQHGLVYSNKSKWILPLDLMRWRSWASKDWHALKMHHDGGFISRSRIGNHLAMWNIYLFLILVVFVAIDVIRWIVMGFKKRLNL